ncbi:Protein muscleblind [Temnothorax longispinosus]|uniref:Protein muscleblind n=1 Tax=Temnothorax longispinosus TaxID=300112 RepID=A0A4S2JBB7_9HYME|nr:Protein muscleblind [Temnothorax longispinosus]
MAMVNMNNLLNGKDSRWLQLEVCREFQRNKCTRPDTECKFAHPPANVEVQNGRVTACYDSIKVTNRCIIEFSYSRVTSAFARSGIVGHVVLNCSGDNSRPRWRLGLPGCKYDDEGNGVELKSPDEKLARETISESGEPGNPISGLFHGRCEKRREGVVFLGLLRSPIRDAAQRQQKDDRNAKGEHADCGSKAMLRVCNSTNKDDRYRCEGRNIRASGDKENLGESLGRYNRRDARIRESRVSKFAQMKRYCSPRSSKFDCRVVSLEARIHFRAYNGYTPRAAFQSQPAYGRSIEVPYWLFTIGQAEHHATVDSSFTFFSLSEREHCRLRLKAVCHVPTYVLTNANDK